MAVALHPGHSQAFVSPLLGAPQLGVVSPQVVVCVAVVCVRLGVGVGVGGVGNGTDQKIPHPLVPVPVHTPSSYRPISEDLFRSDGSYIGGNIGQ